MTTIRGIRFFITAVTATILGSAALSAGAENQGGDVPPRIEMPAVQPQPQAAVPVAPPVAIPVPAAQGKTGPRIGYVDIMKIADESTLAKASKVRLKERGDKLQVQLDAKQKQLEKQKSALEAKLPTLNPDQRGAKIKEYEKKVEEFRKSVKNAEKEMQPLQEELTMSITEATLAACETYGKENGFTVIAVRKDLLYVDSGAVPADVTSEILSLMNLKK